jgi:predicted nuclease of restriction endonuclease-like (RecB) superfamily
MKQPAKKSTQPPAKKATPKMRKARSVMIQIKEPSAPSSSLFVDLCDLIERARDHAASTVNSALTQLYWKVGERIRMEAVQSARAQYGDEIVATVSQQLVLEYGKGYSFSALTRMMKFSEVFPDFKIVATLSQQLSWSHFIEILPLKQPLEREFYAQMCSIERWSVRTLRERIGSQLYLRSAIAKKPETVIAQELSHLREGGQITPDLVFRDPYMLDFLGLPDGYNEKDLENAILRDMERFLLELGAGFSFVARQKRISVGADDFYLDLLFFHRHLRRLVAVELKLEKFSPSHKGQMELYLRWLDQHERAEGEASPIGLILCASADREQVQLMDLESANIRVAQYLHALPDMKLLQAQLHRIAHLARERHARLNVPSLKIKA